MLIRILVWANLVDSLYLILSRYKPTNYLCFQYIGYICVGQYSMQMVGQFWMQFNNLAGYFDRIIAPSRDSRTVTIERLFWTIGLNDAVLQVLQIHVSKLVLVFVRRSYYNGPWLDSPCWFNGLSLSVLYQIRVNQASLFNLLTGQ